MAQKSKKKPVKKTKPKKGKPMDGPLIVGIAHHSPLDVLNFVPESAGFAFVNGIRNIKGPKVLCFADAEELRKAKIEVLDEKNSKPKALSAEIFKKHLGLK